MEVDGLLDELKAVDELRSDKGDPSLESLELEVLVGKERRERCLQPFCLLQNKGPSKKEEDIKRNNEIRNFLGRPQTIPSPHTDPNQPQRSSVRQSKKQPCVYRFAAEVKGVPVSITSALTGDRVYCSKSKWKQESAEIDVEMEAPQVSAASVEDVQQKMEETTIRTPPDSDAQTMEGGNAFEYWVHKYAPRSFSDLITNDKVNRELMKWLKTWKPTRPEKRQSSQNHPSNATKTPQKSAANKSSPIKITDFFSPTMHGAGPSGTDLRTSTEQKPNSFRLSCDPAEKKVLILCGSLGVGKTCLAKIAARMCGYQPFVIDASDDRSPASLESLLKAVLETKSVFAKRLPNCIIFDEIDTLPPGAESRQSIHKIVDHIDGRNRNKKRDNYLKKPMIFICNELHASYLAPLRPLAKILYVPQTKVNTTLVSRLKTICEKEHISMDASELISLVERNENDISACLNTLEFQSRCSAASVMGSKIMKRTPFEIWESILAPSRDECSFVELLKLYQNFDGFELIVRGIYWNYIRMHSQDGQFKKNKRIAGLVSEMSSMLHRVPSYCPVLFVAVRRILSSVDRDVKIEWPKEDFETARQLHFNTNALDNFRHDLHPHVSMQFSREALTMDVLPYVTTMTQTGMSSTNLGHVLSGECRQILLTTIQSAHPTSSPVSDRTAISPSHDNIQWKRKAEHSEDPHKKTRPNS